MIRLNEVNFGYPDAPPVLEGLDLEVEAGEKVGLVGANGSGKTTLLQLVVGLEKPDSGTVVVFGRECNGESDFHEVRNRVGFLFENPADQLFNPTVLEEVAFGPINQGLSRSEAEARARRVLERLGLEGYESRVPFHLSGGEKKLVALASVLATQPEALLLDEPLAGFDRQVSEKIRELFEREELTVVSTSHDRRLLDELVDRVYELNSGKLDPA